VSELYVVTEESARLGSAYVCKLIRVDREEVGKLGRDGWAYSGTCLDLVCLGAHLELPHLGVCRGILHEGIVGMKVLDVASQIIKPLCVSSLAVVSGRSRSSARWMDPLCPTPKVGSWSGGVWVERRRLSSGRALALARRSGRVSSRRDPSDGQVSSVVDFAIPLLRRGARAFIVNAIGHSYLISLLSLLLTIPLLLTMSSVTLTVRRAPVVIPEPSPPRWRMEALRKQASKLREQVARQQQVILDHRTLLRLYLLPWSLPVLASICVHRFPV
ncbi:hypothetical protein BHE74_00034440, partial [Ensete ventricosum]